MGQHISSHRKPQYPENTDKSQTFESRHVHQQTVSVNINREPSQKVTLIGAKSATSMQ